MKKLNRIFGTAATVAALLFSLTIMSCSAASDGPSVLPPPLPTTPTTTPEQTNAQSIPVTLETPLTLEAAEAGAVVTFVNKASNSVTYKVNGGTAQTIASGESKAITLTSVGDKVEFFGDNKSYGNGNDSNIACNKDCYVYGNIMSLIKSEGFESVTVLEEKRTFQGLFYNNAHIENKDGADLILPATTLTESCYYSMFEGCANLAVAPALPATTLAESCYCGMFDHCTNLTKAPELPATEIFYNCYAYMFYFCENLASAPALPATEMKEMCYHTMFTGCKKLTAAPALPATKLAKKCYTTMFALCENLESAPELPAETLVEECYASMFLNCSSLSSVTCLATDIGAQFCTDNWLGGVAQTGTFKKATGMTAWQTGSSGIPSGWTVNNK